MEPLLPAIDMDDLKFFGGLAAITAFVIALFVYAGRKVSKAAERNAEFIGLPLYVTRTGTIFFACVVAFWVYCVSVRMLSPGSRFGAYLGTAEGAVSILFGSITFIGVAWVIFEKLGYPMAKWHED